MQTTAFQRPWTATVVIVVFLLLLTGVYFLVHIFREPVKSVPWDDAVVVFESTYQVEFIDEKLVKYFTKAQIRDLRGRITADADRYREDSIKWRRRHLPPMAEVFENTFPAHPLRPGRKVADGEVDFYLFDTVSLVRLLTFIDTKLREGGISEKPTASLESFRMDLETRLAIEKERVELLRSMTKALEPPLSFRWLYHAKQGWLLEVTFWTLVGVLANTLIALIKAWRANDYKPNEFVLVLPKAVLAPFLSVVVIALISSGFTEYGVTVMNLPWLLVLSFFLGFGTETLYEKLRETMSLIVSRATKVTPESLDRLKRSDLRSWIRRQEPPEPASVPPATGLKTLRPALETVAMDRVRLPLARRFVERAPDPGADKE